MKIRQFSGLILLILFSITVKAQNAAQHIDFKIDWNHPMEMGSKFGEEKIFLSFEGAQYDFAKSDLPFFYEILPVKGEVDTSSAVISNAEFVALSGEEQQQFDGYEFQSAIYPEIINAVSRKKPLSFLKLYPFRKNANTGEIEKLVSFQLGYSVLPSGFGRRDKANSYVSNSVLATGDWFKVGILENKVYKLSYYFLKSMGMDVDNINPNNFRVYGNGAGQLPGLNSDPRSDDLLENAIMVVGGEDGSFDREDYLVFYGEGSVKWDYDAAKRVYKHQTHYYSDTNFYFITADLGPGKRISSRADGSTLNPTKTIRAFLDFQVLEQDRINLLHSGREWVGDLYESKTSYSYTFNFPNVLTDSSSWFEFSGVVRSGVSSSFQINLANQNFIINGMNTDVGNYLAPHGTEAASDFYFNPNADLLKMDVSYTKPRNTSKAWLNYIELNVWRKLSFTGGQMDFRNPYANNGVYEFRINNAVPSLSIWDITDKHEIMGQEFFTTAQNEIAFRSSGNRFREYIVFDRLDSSVVPMGKVPNQNLHALGQIDMAIVTNPLFLQQAQQLADFHESNGLSVAVVSPKQIYNEFSSGMQDPVAIRTFMKMFYDRANNDDEMPSYLLLIGDASFDPKNRISGNTNYVLTYESPIYLNPINSFASDDYYGFLDDGEGLWYNDKLDIGIGRLPVRTQTEAQAMVNKILNYASTESFGEWRNELVFLGDDEDNNMHMDQADNLASIVEDNNGEFNVSRILADSYQEISTPGGARYPGVNQAITEHVESGSLIINYTGHGGETGLGEERFLTLSDISSWNNKNSYPLFITATCEFSRYDDPLRVSAGEEVLLNSSGGSIGLLTTTRPAYAGKNYNMSKYIYRNMFNRIDGKPMTVGELYRLVKVKEAAVPNARNFTYLGDPAIQLAIPQHKVITTRINGQQVSAIDTLNALSRVTVEGYIADYLSGQKMQNFNGLVFPTVFDKKRMVSTLNNNGNGVKTYEVRDSRLFNGKASVKDGEFSFSFVVPKDISYEVGEGKITYYATDYKTDANGYTTELLIGGSSDSALSDSEGPALEMYMNSEDFVYGGITNEDPTVIIEFYDELGINTVGNGIGHDITMTLDGNSEKAIVLNEFYEADVDDYRKGKVKYPMKALAEGQHTLTVKSWDVANNSSEKTIEFVVVKEKDIEIEHVLNYPNPFTTYTEFWFEHNQPGVPLDVKIQIFTVSGKLVKSIDKMVVSEGFRVDNLSWDGKDDFGDKIGRGVYLYKLRVRSRNGSIAEKIEKLFIL